MKRISSEMLSRDHGVAVDPVALEKSISKATEALLGYRQSDGHWVFELEADSTIMQPKIARPKVVISSITGTATVGP